MIRSSNFLYFWKSRNFLFFSISLILFSSLIPFNIDKLSLFIPYFLGIKIFDISFRTLFLSLFFSIVLLFFQFLVPNEKFLYIHFLNDFFNLHEIISDWIDKNYDHQISQVINSLIFNSKKTSIYKDFYDFGIAHLISISGFHIFWISRMMDRVIKNKSFTSCILIIYWCSVNYSIPVFRVLCARLISNRDEYLKWSFSSILALLLNIHIYKLPSFLLSYFFHLLLLFNKLLFSNKVNLFLADSFFSSLFSAIISLWFSKKIFIFQWLNSLIFSPLITLLFIYFFLFWAFPYLSNIHWFFIRIFNTFKSLLPLNSTYLYISDWDYDFLTVSSFILLFVLCFQYIIQKTGDY